MKNETKKNVAHSVNVRLKNMAIQSGIDVEYMFLKYAFERFLYRLSVSVFAEDSLKKSQWQSFIEKTDPVDFPKSLSDAVERIVEFIQPIIAANMAKPLLWKKGEGWQ